MNWNWGKNCSFDCISKWGVLLIDKSWQAMQVVIVARCIAWNWGNSCSLASRPNLFQMVSDDFAGQISVWNQDHKSETFISSVWCDLVLFIVEMRAVLVLIMIAQLPQSSLSYTSSEAWTRTISRFYWISWIRINEIKIKLMKCSSLFP